MGVTFIQNIPKYTRFDMIKQYYNFNLCMYPVDRQLKIDECMLVETYVYKMAYDKFNYLMKFTEIMLNPEQSYQILKEIKNNNIPNFEAPIGYQIDPDTHQLIFFDFLDENQIGGAYDCPLFDVFFRDVRDNADDVDSDSSLEVNIDSDSEIEEFDL